MGRREGRRREQRDGEGEGRGERVRVRGWWERRSGEQGYEGSRAEAWGEAEQRDSGNILFCVGTISYGLEYNYYERMTLGTCFTSGKFTHT